MGFIVMEYVGGSSLKQIMESRRRDDGHLEPLPVAQAIAYALEVLPALGYLHGQGLAYCDFKPDNVIQYDRQLKLIDLGAVIHFDDEDSPIYGTVGYQAPEVGAHGPSPGSDIHTVGRTLAVLALGIGPTRRGAPTPLPDDHPVLARYESFHRVLLRATDPDPYARFASTDEFADQLAGVLREVLALEDGQARPAMSTVFSAPRGAFAADLLGAARPGRPDPARVAAALPVPLVDPTDPAAAQLAAASREQVRRLGDHGPARPRGPAGTGAGRARRGRPGRRPRRARRGRRRRARRLAHRLVPGRRGALHRPGRRRRRLRPGLPDLPRRARPQARARRRRGVRGR